MSQVVEVKGLKELIGKMQAFPVELAKTVSIGIAASLNVFWEKVPPYPRKPAGSRYKRKGSAGLGGSLGSGETGGAKGLEPSVYSVRKLGEGNMEGKFGTNLDYAPYVIGDTTQARQNLHWWQMLDIAIKSQGKVKEIWNGIMKKMVAFLERKGL